MAAIILAIDQGTTSTRAIVFDATLAPVADRAEGIPADYPAPGWVEHDPEEIWATRRSRPRATAMAKAGVAAKDIAAHRHHQPARDHARLGPRDRQADPQRHRLAGPPHRATLCAALARGGPRDAVVSERTGLLLDPYFSATKIAWLLDNVAGRARARRARASSPSAPSTPFCSGG